MLVYFLAPLTNYASQYRFGFEFALSPEWLFFALCNQTKIYTDTSKEKGGRSWCEGAGHGSCPRSKAKVSEFLVSF